MARAQKKEALTSRMARAEHPQSLRYLTRWMYDRPMSSGSFASSSTVNSSPTTTRPHTAATSDMVTSTGWHGQPVCDSKAA